ncbi:MAG: hypothetical protein ACKV2V_16690 [Blastocatellia bacterium]
MNTTQICPSCHGETRRLVYCAISRRHVCAESCALTDADLFLLELSQHRGSLVTAVMAAPASGGAGPVRENNPG